MPDPTMSRGQFVLYTRSDLGVRVAIVERQHATSLKLNLLVLPNRENDVGIGLTKVRAVAYDAGGAAGTWAAAGADVTAARAKVFVSAETTATGSSQNVAHGLGATPTVVLIVPTLHPGTPDTGAFTITEGVHDSTNVKVTMTINCKFKVFAWA